MKPWQSRQEMLVDMALESAVSDPETIRAIRPVVPQQLMPQSRGIVKQEFGIMEVLGVGRQAPAYRSWISGIMVMPRIGQTDDRYGGTSRNSMSVPWG